MSNPQRRKEYERYGRLHKIHTLTKEIDKTVYDILASVPRDAWTRFAIVLGANPPSDKTLTTILSRYKRRYTRRYAEKKPE